MMQVNMCKPFDSQLLLRDRYRVLNILGKGGFGATFLAQDESREGNPKCVIKQLQPATNEPHVIETAQRMFEREANTLRMVGDHSQIPSLFDFFKQNRQFYLVQEYISGLTLQEEIKQQGLLTEVGVKHFLREILPILQHIHHKGVIHRDIKPANIIRREPDGKLVLIDFGAVKDDIAAINPSEQTALTNLAIGTTGYAAPEQMQLRPVYASDIYALGVTCIYLLTGKSPKDLDYNQRTGEMLWQNHVDVSDYFASVLKKMLEEAVKCRYESATEVLRALDLGDHLNKLEGGFTTGKQGKPTVKSPETKRSATERMAEIIRIKREEQNNRSPLPIGVGMMRPINTSGVNTDINWSNSQGYSAGKANLKKLDYNSLMNHYNKGRRDFSYKDLSRLEIGKIDLSAGNFRQAKLFNTNLQGANLAQADFRQANLQMVKMQEANLSRSYFEGADLQGADLQGADLSFADLTNSKLTNANLCGANLTGAKITEEQLKQAKTNWRTILPNKKRVCW